MNKEYIDNWLKNLRSIIIDVNISLNNLKTLSKKESDKIESVKNEFYFIHHKYQLKFIIVIQLAKLFQFSGSQKIALQKLINRLDNEGLKKDFDPQIELNIESGEPHLIKSKQDLINTKEEIRNLIMDKEPLIIKLSDARNQIYAHYDIDEKPEFINISELEELRQLANTIYNIINCRLYNEPTIIFDITTPWNIGNIIDQMTDKAI